MRKIITTTFVTLDGVMQAPGGPEEDRSSNFKWGGWTAHLGDKTTGKAVLELMEKPFDLLLGRKTYDIFAGYWPHQKGPIAKKFDRAHKYVASHKPRKLEWANSSLVKSTAAIAKLKKDKGRNLWVWGSGDLIQSLLKEKLIDAMYVWTYPVTIGTGKRLFAEGTPPQELKLLDQRTSKTGVIISHYKPHGKLRTGTVGA